MESNHFCREFNPAALPVSYLPISPAITNQGLNQTYYEKKELQMNQVVETTRLLLIF